MPDTLPFIDLPQMSHRDISLAKDLKQRGLLSFRNVSKVPPAYRSEDTSIIWYDHIEATDDVRAHMEEFKPLLSEDSWTRLQLFLNPPTVKDCSLPDLFHTIRAQFHPDPVTYRITGDIRDLYIGDSGTILNLTESETGRPYIRAYVSVPLTETYREIL